MFALFLDGILLTRIMNDPRNKNTSLTDSEMVDMAEAFEEAEEYIDGRSNDFDIDYFIPEE